MEDCGQNVVDPMGVDDVASAHSNSNSNSNSNSRPGRRVSLCVRTLVLARPCEELEATTTTMSGREALNRNRNGNGNRNDE
jgi:hypothetical protein